MMYRKCPFLLYHCFSSIYFRRSSNLLRCQFSQFVTKIEESTLPTVDSPTCPEYQVLKVKNKGKNVKKENFPHKICAVCGRPYQWRKKWANVWDDVKYCSERCRKSRKTASADDAQDDVIKSLSARRHFILSYAIVASGFGSNLHSASAKDSPSAEDIVSVFDNVEWDSENPFTSESFFRLDETDDSRFYSTPKFVEHVDSKAQGALTDFYEKFLTDAQRYRYPSDPTRRLDILDLCASHVSHLPSNFKGNGGYSKVIGLGMNIDELKINSQLTDFVVKDLNKDPTLPFDDSSFDAVLCALSIDYLTKPLQVLHEASRILRKGGVIAIIFSDRLFISKAVAVWTGASDLDHMFTVGQYLHYSNGNFSNIRAMSLVKDSSKRGDPLYAVVAMKD